MKIYSEILCKHVAAYIANTRRAPEDFTAECIREIAGRSGTAQPTVLRYIDECFLSDLQPVSDATQRVFDNFPAQESHIGKAMQRVISQLYIATEIAMPR